VDNTPIIGEDRIPKLKGVLIKLYSQINASEVFDEKNIYLPVDSNTKQTLG